MTTIISIIASITFAILFLIKTIKVLKLKKEKKENKNIYSKTIFNIQKEYLSIQKDFSTKQRNGYYIAKYDLSNPNEKFRTKTKLELKIYVKEIEKYTNGYSKIKLIDIETIICPLNSQTQAKEYAESVFSTTKKNK